MNESLQDLIDKTLNGIATDEEARALEEQLLDNADARDQYLNCVNLHSSMVRRFAAPEEPANIESFPRRISAKTIAIAAALILFAGLAIITQLPGKKENSIAVISQVVGAYTETQDAFEIGQLIPSGHLKIERGLIKLDFSNGAQLTLEGPANLQVNNENEVVLHSGIVTATIPESAIGFTVDTSTARVVDLGTAFGVSVNHDGSTDVCVFDGEVEVSPPAELDTTKLVKEGQAVRASSDSQTITTVSYDPAQFENAWPLSSGVLQTTGNMRFVSPGPDFHPGNFEDNENIVVFPERSNFTPEKPIRVDLVDPGQYKRAHYNEKRTLPSGRKVTSYLLQLDSFPEGKHPNIQRRVQGQITFAKPISGVITMTRLLKESEAIFGNPDVQYRVAREIEPRPEGDQRPGFDSLTLAADRRTLIVDLMESPGHLDQIRVLVETD